MFGIGLKSQSSPPPIPNRRRRSSVKLQPGATTRADENNIRRIPINELRQEEGAHELAT
jgi:hypothetical protein